MRVPETPPFAPYHGSCGGVLVLAIDTPLGHATGRPSAWCRRVQLSKNALWTRELRKSFKEWFGSTRNAERKGRTPTLDPLCQLAPVVNGWGLSVASTNKSLA